MIKSNLSHNQIEIIYGLIVGLVATSNEISIVGLVVSVPGMDL